MKFSFKNDLAFALHITNHDIKFTTQGKKKNYLKGSVHFTGQHKSATSLRNAEVHGILKNICDLLSSTESTLKELLWLPKQAALCDVTSAIMLLYSGLFSEV